MSIYEKLFRIQQEAISPKDQFNEFGGFKFRNVEVILRMVKPVLEKYKAYILLTDYAVEINGQTYIKAKAELYDIETGEHLCSEAYAREMESKKGMDTSQCTGSASSYARKYALSGLLGLDDSKVAPNPDPDTGKPEDQDEDMKRRTLRKSIKLAMSKAGFDQADEQRTIIGQAKVEIGATKSVNEMDCDELGSLKATIDDIIRRAQR